MKKIFVVIFAILLFTNLSFAANGSGKLSNISGYMQAIAGMPAGYHLTFNEHTPATGPSLFISDENVSEWKVGDDVSFMDPDGSHPCESKSADTILINATRAEWVCAVAVGKK